MSASKVEQASLAHGVSIFEARTVDNCKRPENNITYFKCYNGQCLNTQNSVCDGTFDCIEKSESKNNTM